MTVVHPGVGRGPGAPPEHTGHLIRFKTTTRSHAGVVTGEVRVVDSTQSATRRTGSGGWERPPTPLKEHPDRFRP